jgi:hypothetical protein
MDAFFTREGQSLVPSPMARSPWAPDMMHGRYLAGLLARAIEIEHGDPEFHPGRITVDLFRSPPMHPLEVTTKVARTGNRIRVVDGEVTMDGGVYARASVVLLKRSEQPAGEVWTPPPWDAPHPTTLPEPEFEAPWDMRSVSESWFGAFEQKRIWLREIRELVAGEEMTPFVRAATAADIANPLVNSGTNGLEFINGDITLYLARLPVDEWIGFEASHHISADGIAVGGSIVYDTHGPIGTSTVGALAQRRMRNS